MKIDLPQVTLICLANVDFEGHKKALDKSREGINFGAVKLIWDDKISNIDEWNYKIIYELPNYVDTDYALLIHADGYVINPHLWNEKWLGYDYIGSPWPLPSDDYSYRDELGNVIRVGNSVSLRSKKLMDSMQRVSKDYFWSMKNKYGNTNEDGFITCHNRNFLERQGLKFAPLEEAIHFGKEHTIPENVGLETFLFHSL